jgi:hypothetical protein
MKIITTIGHREIIMTEKRIDDVFYIMQNEETKNFYYTNKDGFSTIYELEFKDLDKAIKHVKDQIKFYFISRGLDNPKGF